MSLAGAGHDGDSGAHSTAICLLPPFPSRSGAEGNLWGVRAHLAQAHLFTSCLFSLGGSCSHKEAPVTAAPAQPDCEDFC